MTFLVLDISGYTPLAELERSVTTCGINDNIPDPFQIKSSRKALTIYQVDPASISMSRDIVCQGQDEAGPDLTEGWNWGELDSYAESLVPAKDPSWCQQIEGLWQVGHGVTLGFATVGFNNNLKKLG